MKTFKTFLTEAPLADYDDRDVGNRRTPTGKVPKNAKSSFTKKDQALIKSARTKEKVAKVLKAFKQDFRFYFADFEGSNRWAEHGILTDAELKGESKLLNYMEKIGILSPIGGLTDTAKKSISVIYVSNVGDSKIGMTPWIMMHRLGHGINAGQKKTFTDQFEQQLRLEIYEFLTSNYTPDENVYTDDARYDRVREEWDKILAPVRRRKTGEGQDVLHWFLRTFGNFNSARRTGEYVQGKGSKTKAVVRPERYYEMIYDTFVAFLWYAQNSRNAWDDEETKRLPFKFDPEDVPEKLTFDSSANRGAGRKISLAVSDEFVHDQAKDYYRTMIASTMRNVDKMFDQLEGKVIVM